jgi:hypothetical protein
MSSRPSRIRRADVSDIQWKRVQSAKKAASDRIAYQRHLDVKRINERLALRQKRSLEHFANESAILRNAARGKGNFNLGQASVKNAKNLGESWVGKGFIISSNGKILTSADGLRQFRYPSYKPKIGKIQANFEQRFKSEGRWQSNGHLDIS